MKTIKFIPFLTLALLIQCAAPEQSNTESSEIEASTPVSGQAAVMDDVSANNIVKVAVGSPDHTTLVAAVQAAGLVDVLANPGPFTVFAPTDEGFCRVT